MATAAEVRDLEAAKLNLEIQQLEIENASLRRQEDKILAEGDFSGQFSFVGGVSEVSVHSLMGRLENWSKRNSGQAIELVINSGGGSVVDGLALIDYLRLLRKRGHRVTCIGVGLVASMASALLQAGDERVMSSRCYMGLHEVSSLVQGSLTIQEDHIKFSKELQDRIVDLYCERSNLTPRKLETRWQRKDVYVSASEALKLGLIDRIEEV